MSLKRQVTSYAFRTLNKFPFLWGIFKLFPAFDDRTNLLKRLPRKSVGAEIGVWKGDFSERIYHIVSPTKLYLVDPWEYNPAYPARMYGGKVANSQSDMDAIFNAVSKRFRNRPNVIIERHQSSEFFSKSNVEYMNFVYIDGNHSYDYVLKDLELSKKLVKSGGCITGDDFFWKDADGSMPIKDAVENFAETHRLTYNIFGNQFLIKL
jgi:hypothetical protein